MLIKKIAVLGAGVMGAQIAAHCVNARIETLLFDMPTEGPDVNKIPKAAIENLKKIKPAPFGDTQSILYLTPCNYKEHLDKFLDCDLIIEAIAEKQNLKINLYNLIEQYLKPTAILATNTSGLSIQDLSSELPTNLQHRFVGMHFFNPPRYMHLVELIPSKHTDLELLYFLENWLARYLGKGVIRAKDTPNFIANRIGVFALLNAIHMAEKLNLSPDEVDALTGVLIGRPKSATFRTMDVVGLDTLKHVVDTMQIKLTDDPWHEQFKLPDWILQLINKNHLGQKTGQGIYRKVGNNIEVFDPKLMDYRAVSTQTPDSNKQEKFLASCAEDLSKYSAFHLENIAHSSRDVDLAMQWGFGWKEGPFKSKLEETTKKLIFENQAVKLWHYQDEVVVVSLKTKANTINSLVIDGLNQVLDLVESKYAGLIIYQDNPNIFSAGAELTGIFNSMQNNKFQEIDDLLKNFQMLMMRFKYSSVPNIAAMRGRALGGGCELLMHCQRVVAAFESYVGLVELGVGLIPAGGGCKEMALRAALNSDFIEPYFMQIAKGVVTNSARDAVNLGYLRAQDGIIMQADDILHSAFLQIKAMDAINIGQQLVQKFKVAGKEGHARLNLTLVNLLEGNFITNDDYNIAERLAYVLCGGDLHEGDLIDEFEMLNLERKVFVDLTKQEATRSKIESFIYKKAV